MPSTADLLAFTAVSSRAESVVFDVLNSLLVKIGEVTPAEPAASISNDTTRRGMRTLDALHLTPSDTADINPLTDRIRPSWRFVGDTLYPLGVFVFANPQRQRHTWGLESTNNLTDLSVLIDVPSRTAVGFPADMFVVEAIASYAVKLGLTPISVAGSSVRIGQPMAWPPGTSCYDIFADLATLATFFPPYFDNQARFTFRPMPLKLALAAHSFTYEEGGIVEADTITESDDLLVAPNRYIVIGGGTLNEAPIVGTFDIPPEAANSIAHRNGAVVAKVITVQGAINQAQADAIAQGEYTKERIGSQAEFDTVADPRHDTFDVVRYNGMNYLETAWSLELTAGGAHHHVLRGVRT